MNADVNEMARVGRSARPVYGYRPHNGNPDGAENCFVLETDEYVYLGVVNYHGQALCGCVSLAHLGLKPKSVAGAKELWTGVDVTLSDDGVEYAVPGKDARIYRLCKK